MATQVECARHLYCSAQHFRALLDSGIVTRQPPDKYNLDTVRREVFAHLRAQAAGRGAGETLAAERAALARAQRELTQMKVDQFRGQLVDIEVVGAALEDRYAVCKERLLAIPGKCADELSHRERVDVVDILRREIYEALNELSEPSALIREAGGQPDGAGPIAKSDRSGAPGVLPTAD